MKQQLHTFIMGLLTLSAVYLYFLSTEPLEASIEIKAFPTLNSDHEEKEALNYLNYLRTKAGLIPFSSHDTLKRAAKNHANYLTNHLTYGHEELEKFKDYTGQYASNRLHTIGYVTSQVIENVSSNNKNYKESIDGLFAAIYHRQAFLDFRSDTIGVGVSQNQRTKDSTAFVYDMSSKSLEELYTKEKEPSMVALREALQANKKKNAPFVIYPFDKQLSVPPAFFDELPDPLPEHRVSGFPISISFNPAIYKEVKPIMFKIYDNKAQELNETVVYTQKSDINQRLGKFDFVLFPLKRLAWNKKYTVVFLAEVDHKLVKKVWTFSTKKFAEPFFIVKKEEQRYKLKVNEPAVFYFPPKSKRDILSSIAYPENFDVEFIDKNTVKITLLANIKREIELTIGTHKITVVCKK